MAPSLESCWRVGSRAKLTSQLLGSTMFTSFNRRCINELKTPKNYEKDGSSIDIKPIFVSIIVSTLASIKPKQLTVTNVASKHLTDTLQHVPKITKRVVQGPWTVSNYQRTSRHISVNMEILKYYSATASYI